MHFNFKSGIRITLCASNPGFKVDNVMNNVIHLKSRISSLWDRTAPVAHTRYLSSSPAATLHGKTQGFVLRLPPHNIAHATFMQPFQCDLPPRRQETHRTTHTGTTNRCKTHRRNRLNSKRSKPHPSHTRGTLHRRLQPLYTEKHKVSCSGFLPTT